MLATDEFKKFAANVVLFLHNTSKVEDEPYPNLLREKGGNGYPTVSFMDHTGRVLTQQPFKKLTVPEIRKTFDRLQEWRKLKASGDPKLGKRLFVVEMEFGLLAFDEAKAAFAKVGDQLSADEKAWIGKAMLELEFLSILKTIDIAKKATLVNAGKKFVAMIESDRIPQGPQITTFWHGALTYAKSKSNADLFEKIMHRAKKELVGDFRVKRYLEDVEAQLKRMRRVKR